MIQLVENSYMMLAINNHFLLRPPYHPGCPQIHNPERYCLVTDDPAFCKTIGDICDADGFVKPEDAYCTK
jgi:hypothetical protein